MAMKWEHAATCFRTGGAWWGAGLRSRLAQGTMTLDHPQRGEMQRQTPTANDASWGSRTSQAERATTSLHQLVNGW